jgi:membrane protease YdiL (CAAX protease family)
VKPWVVLAALSPLALATLAAAVGDFATGERPDLATLGRVEYLGDIGLPLALLLWLATFGFGEEIGWRGFAVDSMQKSGWHTLKAAAVIAPVWALWHLPAFFYKPTLMALGAVEIIGYVLGLTAGSVLLAWLYISARASILLVAIWHGLFDLLTTSEASQGLITATVSTLVMLWAAAIVVWYIVKDRGRRGLTKGRRLAYTEGAN